VWGITPRELLAKAGVKPDFSYAGEKPDSFVDWIHRSTKGKEIYFVANRLNRMEKSPCAFRVSGMRPELWDPVTGMLRDLPEFEDKDGLTTVLMQLEPYGSVFVVFQKKSQINDAKSPNFPTLTTAQELTEAWQVTFDPKWGGPGQVSFEKLDDWIERPEVGIKFYSGTAIYHKSFTFAGGAGNRTPLYLSLGSVKYIARVKLNGKDLGIVWTAPWRVEITGTVMEGSNELEVEVVNLWPNRRIGDASLPEEKRYTHSNIAFSPINPQNPPDRSGLFPSGLMGPVVIQAVSLGEAK